MSHEDRASYGLYVALGIALIAAFALADYVGERRKRASEAADDETSAQKKDPSDHSRASGTLSAVLIPSCTCMSPHAMAPVEAKLLAPPIDGSQPWTIDVRRDFSRSTSKLPLALRDDAVLTPGSSANAPRFGIACDENVFLLVARDAVTAWSSRDGTWKWNARMAAPIADSFKTECLQLDIVGPAVVVPLSSGATAKLALSDGRPVPE